MTDHTAIPASTDGTLDRTAVLHRIPSPDVEWVEIDGQVVAWNERTETLHLLDPTAGLVYQLLDGRSSLTEIVLDLAAAFENDLGQVERDVLRLASSLEDMALVERAP